MTIQATTIPTILGVDSIGTSQLQDGSVTNDKLAFGVDSVKASGVLAIASTTTSYDTSGSYVDVDFSALELTNDDVIEVEIWGANNVTQDFTIRLDTVNTSTEVNSTEFTIPTSGSPKFTCYLKVRNSFTANDVLSILTRHTTSSGGALTLDSLDTNDANIMTTAWTLRINGKHASSSNGTSNVFYTVKVVRPN